mmetsp:Transcript_732/g.2086  ORF Transcript_732/g.2086 Transcript_732/m.2086 type:complete len:276 (+) Transcript_732:1181-2008(+)
MHILLAHDHGCIAPQLGLLLFLQMKRDLVQHDARKDDAASQKVRGVEMIVEEVDSDKDGDDLLDDAADHEDDGGRLEDEVEFAQDHADGDDATDDAEGDELGQFRLDLFVLMQCCDGILDEQGDGDHGEEHAGCQQPHRDDGRLERRFHGLELELDQGPTRTGEHGGRETQQETHEIELHFARDCEQFSDRDDEDDPQQTPRDLFDSKQVGPYENEDGRRRLDHGVECDGDGDEGDVGQADVSRCDPTARQRDGHPFRPRHVAKPIRAKVFREDL